MPLTRREAAVITAYTGIFMGTWDAFHLYAQELMGRPVWTHEFANRELMATLKEKATPEFMEIAGNTVEGEAHG